MVAALLVSEASGTWLAGTAIAAKRKSGCGTRCRRPLAPTLRSGAHVCQIRSAPVLALEPLSARHRIPPPDFWRDVRDEIPRGAHRRPVCLLAAQHRGV